MLEMKSIPKTALSSHTTVDPPPWQRIFKFALAAWIFGMLSLAMMAAGFLSGCSGGGGGGGSSDSSDNAVVNSLSQYVLPGEISAVPASKDENLQTSSVTAKKTVTVNKYGYSTFSSLAKAFSDADTDYTKTKASKYVEEPALEQFSVLEDVLTALKQTKYYENIGQPAYKAMVTQVGGEDGQDRKSLMTWVVESDILNANGDVVEPNRAVEGVEYDVRVRAWIEEEGHILKGQFVITDPPSQDEDGAYLDYGTWTLNVSFVDDGSEFFAASCSVDAQGQSVIRIHDKEGPQGPGSATTMGFMTETKAIMYRSDNEGYGQVSYFNWDDFDWNQFQDPNFDPSTLNPDDYTDTAKYAYNENYLALQEGSDPPTYKDRSDVVEMTHRYGVFRYDNGDDVMRHKQFGFPFWYEEGGVRKHGYYGAWQGRHQLWTDNEGGIPEGTVVTREDYGSDTAAETYTIGKTFNGTLTKRTYIPASLDDIKNIPSEIWVNKNFQLLYMSGDQGTDWYLCKDIDFTNWPTLACNTTAIHFESQIGYESLVVSVNDDRKQVNINGWDNSIAYPGDGNKNFVYLMAGMSGATTAGFYEAEPDQESPWKYVAIDPPVPLDTTNVNQLWIWIGGSLYVEYKGVDTGWVQKEVTGFDEDRWMPEFGTNDIPYTLPTNTELYINMQGVNYVVTKDANGTDVQLELQATLNPVNAGTIVPNGTVFSDPWDMDGVNSTYEFITDPSNAKYLMLVYKTIGQNDKDQDGEPLYAAGDVVENGMWGIEDASGEAYNWEYSSTDNGGWGSVTYLMNTSQYLLLDDPVRFQSKEITHNGVTKTLGLQYDGWMMGLPDLYYELERNGWTMTDDIKNKIINLPAGTVLDSVEGVQYVLKPLEISQFLMPVADGTPGVPDISAADTVDLSTVPDFVDHGMGDMPSNTVVRYSEGLPVD